MTGAASSLAKRFVVATSLVACSLAAALVVLEAALRTFYPMSDFFWQWDTRIGMKLIPGKQGRSVKPGAFDVAVSVNADGFRDRDHALEKTSGTHRVVLLGDSFVEALQVPFEHSITAALQDRIERHGRKVETINFGVSGSGTARQYLALREYGQRYTPDLVLLFFVGNDISDNSLRLKGEPHFPYPLLSPEGKLLRDDSGAPLFTSFAPPAPRLALPDAVKHHWKTYRFLRQLFDQTAPPSATQGMGYYELYRSPPQPAWAEAWKATEELLLATRDLAHAGKAKFGVVLVPSAWEVYPALWSEVLAQRPEMRHTSVDPTYPSTRLKQFLEANGVVVFDLLGEFRRRAEELPLLYLPRDAHWTSDGHRLAGELLAQPVAAMLGVAPAAR